MNSVPPEMIFCLNKTRKQIADIINDREHFCFGDANNVARQIQDILAEYLNAYKFFKNDKVKNPNAKIKK